MNKITIHNIIVQYIKENPIYFSIYCLTVLYLPIMDVILPSYYGKIISELFVKKNTKMYFIIIIILITIVQILIFTNDIVETLLFPRMHEFTRSYCLKYIMNENSTNLQEVEIGKILAKMIRFAPMLYNYIDLWKEEIIPFTLVYIIMIIYLYTKDLYLALIILILMIVITYLTFKSMNSCAVLSQQRDIYYNEIYEEIDEILRNLISIVNNNSYPHEDKRIKVLEKKFKIYSINAIFCSSKYKFLFILLFSILMVFFALRCIYLYKSSILDNPTFIGIIIMMIFLFNIVLKHTTLFKNLMLRYGTLTEAISFLNSKIDDTENKSIDIKKIDNNNHHHIVINNVSFAYDNKPNILNNIYIEIGYNQNVAIIGNIGCGKSTIIKLLMKYNTPSKGDIFMNGNPYSSMDSEKIRINIGYIPQSAPLFNRTLMDNIKYGNIKAHDKDVYELIEKLELNAHFNRYPNGLNTNAGKNGSNLSGGEKQIIWILRILLQNSEIILLDEPTSAMDDDTKDTLLKLLMKIFINKTVICVTHDLEILKYFDKVYIIKNGIATIKK